MTDVYADHATEVNRNADTDQVIALFKFLKEWNNLAQKNVLDMRECPWHQMLSEVPDDPENIWVNPMDGIEENDRYEGDDRILLSVRKPEFQRCPEPDPIFGEWLEDGWSDFEKNAAVLEYRDRKDPPELSWIPEMEETTDEKVFLMPETEETSNDQTLLTVQEREYFEDDAERVARYQAWAELRNQWVDRQETIGHTRDFFSDLYAKYYDILRDSETDELIVGNGLLHDRKNARICHPILTKPVKLKFDAERNRIYILDTEDHSDLYTMLLRNMDDINLDMIRDHQEDLQAQDYHPMDHDSSAPFLKAITQSLSSDSIFLDRDTPENIDNHNRLSISWAPCFIHRKRLNGTSAMIEAIIEYIESTGYVPNPIREIVGGEKTIPVPDGDNREESPVEQLAAVGGESKEILLAKEANKEQLEIAKRIERYNAVLVQGPPGTGKTHTIANLMGHFLAQGKTVLVTSQTSKAMSVLKEKIPKGLQSLCVSVLDGSRADMEKSVDEITDYMAQNESGKVKREADDLVRERKQVIRDLAKVRENIFAIIHQERGSIVCSGETIVLSDAAKFVRKHADDLSYIPGKVRLDSPLPLTFSELQQLYRTNVSLSGYDEAELDTSLPDPSSVLTPQDFSGALQAEKAADTRLQEVRGRSAWQIDDRRPECCIGFSRGSCQFTIPYPEDHQLSELKQFAGSSDTMQEWMKYTAVDGKSNDNHRQRWVMLLAKILEVYDKAEKVLGAVFGHEITYDETENTSELKEALDKLKGQFERKGKISKFFLMLNKTVAPVYEKISFDGRRLQSEEECDLVLDMAELHDLRKQCGNYWDTLLAAHGAPSFFDLDANEPERMAKEWIPPIQKYLDWFGETFCPLMNCMDRMKIPTEKFFRISLTDSDIDKTNKILTAVDQDLPVIVEACDAILSMNREADKIRRNEWILEQGTLPESGICQHLVQACRDCDAESYEKAYMELQTTYEKYALQKQRQDLLNKLSPIAPQWADAILHREGIHGLETVPDTIEDAWRWKQYSGFIDRIMSKPFEEWQKQSAELSKKYRKVTADYAEKLAWYHLLKKTEGDTRMQQALQGWRQTVKKIGKGTGKRAPKLKAEARRLMGVCQEAVPGWIMPIRRALETLDCRTNRFDVLIIDEASQADISSLAILYMGKKLIIVGDDQQVNPMSIGVKDDDIGKLQQMYLKDQDQDIIPNAHLYDGKTSVYDIAKTTFQPLMLEEHFRCVPDIIGFCNMLSYHYKIRPLREASSSHLRPAVVNYRVRDGERSRNKTNVREADSIVALLNACLDQEEYAGKTFGVISLLGQEQAVLIQREIEKNIDAKAIQERRILCGIPPNFQGDERDVIFLSMVDSANGDGPARLQGFGVDDSIRKRYNVAVSRAKDQLWVVHSFDPANDLKDGDIRKTLIEYADNPSAFRHTEEEIQSKSESPFETSVALALTDKGYHIVQQWEVGSYRIDMVAIYQKRTMAIECDGDRYHSGESQIRADMERQTILERLGWHFIRIRGSEYYRNPEETIQHVMDELKENGIEPEEQETESESDGRSELVNRVICIAENSLLNPDEEENFGTVEFQPTDEKESLSDVVDIMPENDSSEEAPNPMESLSARKSVSEEKTENSSPTKAKKELIIEQLTIDDVGKARTR